MASLFRTGLLGGLGVLALHGCGGVCGDDGFEWQQAGNQACRVSSTTDASTSSSTGVIGSTSSITGTSTGDPTTGGSTTTDTTTTSSTTTDSTTTDSTTSDSTTAVLPFCGDGAIDPGEACDDGPDNGPGNACNADCSLNVCGDGVIGPGEGCDNGVQNGPGNACTATCTPNVCGDGMVGPGEGCDDGDMDDADECTNACVLASCGDGIVSVSELCDDGNLLDDDLCTSACTPAACGDGFTQPIAGEACDDANANNDNGDCTSLCNLAACGDGLLHDQGMGGETCDNGPNNGPGKACNLECALNVCGDGDQSPTEGCDDGNLLANDGCGPDCVLEVCGDNKVNLGEACDDGKNGDPDDGCTDLCALPICGDSLLQPSLGEACDLGDQNNDGGACTLGCQAASCGDGKLWAGVEQCDDGPGNADSNACKLDCTTNVCGDGLVLVGVEECDDANDVDGDGCSNVCKSATCNDGVQNGNEVDVDCGGPVCGICPSVLLLAGGNTGPNGTLAGTFTVKTGWTLNPLAGITVEGVALTMTTANQGVGLQRFTQIGNPQDNQLQYTTWNKGVWSPVAQLGANTTKGWPAIDAANTTAQAVFHGQDNKLYYASFINGAWMPASELTGVTSTTVAPDIAALGDNAVMLYNSPGFNNNIAHRPRNGGVWGVTTSLSPNKSFLFPPDIVTLTSGPELIGLWPFFTNNVNTIRYAFRTAGVWGAGANIPGLVTNSRPAVVALSGGAIGLAYRDANSKFQAMIWNGVIWQGPLPMNGNPTITGSPAISVGIGDAIAEAAFVSGGQVFHSRFLLANLSWSVPVALGGADMRSVALASSYP